MTTSVTLIPRSEVPKDHTWNAESVFASPDAWQAEYEATQALIGSLAHYTTQDYTHASQLADWIDAKTDLERRIYKLYVYIGVASATDSANMRYKEMMGQIMGLYGMGASLVAFTEPLLIQLGQEKVTQWLSEDPRLAIYQHYVSDLFRQQAHVLSKELEEVLGLMSEPFRGVEEIASELADADLQFVDAQDSAGNMHPVVQSTVWANMQSGDRTLRRNTWHSYSDEYLAHKNTFAQTLITAAKQQTLLSKLRGYDSVLGYKLSPENLPTDVYHNLINTFKANIKTWHRFWDVKRRILKVDSIHPYDIWAPMTHAEPVVSYAQAVDWISDGMKPLGDDYVRVMRQGCLQDRWVDYAVNEGKRQGAFSSGSYDTMPFIMMSFDNSLGGMSTLAHELGHSMHSYHTREAQPFVYADYSMFVAEVASNFNQAMTRAYLLKTQTDRDFQLSLIQEAIDNFHRYFFIMPTLARLEWDLYSRLESGKPVSVDTVCAMMADLYAEGYGASMTDDPERTSITWAQFMHLYEPYYTFQYATGISAAHALSTDILAGDEQARQNYIRFLSAGSSVYPLDALKIAGVDMTTPVAVEKTYQVLSNMVDRLESLI